MDDNQKKSDRLARIRENQRKSRARKQEYLQELEQRLAMHQTESRRKDIEHRLALQKTEAENRHLRTLLNSLGISTELVQQYVELAEQDVATAKKVAIPAMQKYPKNCTTTTTASLVQEQDSETRNRTRESTRPTTTIPHLMHERIHVSNLDSEKTTGRIEEKPRSTDPPLCKCSTGQQGLTSGPADGDVLNTTLCAIAEELVNQYNTRGTDLDEIRQRLWSGFQAGVTGDGCRVQNKILFQVLDEISHNV